MAQAPSITGISPTSDNAGNSGYLVIYGQNLAPSPVVNISCSSISHSISYTSATQLNVWYTIASNAAAGSCNVSVTTASGTSNSATFTISTAPPPAPIISGISPSSAAQGSSGYISIYGQNLLNGTSTVSVSGGGVTLTNSYVGAGQINVYYTIASTAAVGARSLTVTTASGTSNGATFTVTAPPSIAGISPTSDNAGNSGYLVIYGQNLAPSPSVSIGCSGISFSISYTSTTQLNVWYTIASTAAAATCNVSVTTPSGTSNSVPFTINTAPPPAPVISGISPTSAAQGTSGYISIYGQNLLNGTSTVSMTGGGVTLTNSYVGAGQINVYYTIASTAAIGARTLTVTTASGTSNGETFTVMGPPPTIGSISPTSGPVGTLITISGANFGATQGTSAATLNGTTVPARSWSASAIVVTVLTGCTSGNVVVTVSGVPSNGVAFTVTTPPAVISLSPTSGPRGTAVTISGLNFGPSQGSSTVTFNGTAATSTSWSATSIVALVPPGATTGNVLVTVGGLVSNGGMSFTVTGPYIQSALSFSTSAASYATASGTMSTKVAIWGAGFGSSQGASTITFGGLLAPSVSDPTFCSNECSWSDSKIQVQVPEGARTGNLVVTVNGQPSNPVPFTIVPPSITSVSPSSGYFEDLVVINGGNFGANQFISGDPVNDDAVTFGGVPGPSVHDRTYCDNGCQWNDEQIQIQVPIGALSGNLMVHVDGMATNSVPFTVLSPTITQLSVNIGIPGTNVTISGVNFGASQGQNTVYFNNWAAAPVSTWSNTSIVVTVPATAVSGQLDVKVNGHSSNGVQFTVPGTEPLISSLNPPAGPAGTQVTISGANFGATGTVTFNGTLATPTSWSPTSIVAPAPSGATTGNVVVNANNMTSNGMLFTVTSAPVVYSVSPSSGRPGMLVNITGARFGAMQQSGSTVTFQGTAAAAVTTWSDSAISAVVPPLAVGTNANVVVSVNNVLSLPTAGSYFLVQCCGLIPYITGLSPYWANPGSSGTLSMTGGNLTGVNLISVTPADGCFTLGAPSVAAGGSSLTATFVVCSTAQAGNRLLSVSNGIGSSNALPFAVGAPTPQILNISPSPWPVGPSIAVTITGVGFGSNPGLVFDDPKVASAVCGGAGCSVLCPPLSTPDTCFSALVTVDPTTVLGGTHVAVRSASGAQSAAVPVYYQWAIVTASRAALWQLVMSGSPTPGGWIQVFLGVAGTGAPAVVLPTPPDPATLVMNFLAPPNPSGAPTQGGLARASWWYSTASGVYSLPIEFNAMTFGMSCYGFANEPDWGTPPNSCQSVTIYGVQYSGSSPTAPPGNLPQRPYCNSFLGDLWLQGSGFLSDGTRVHYAGKGNYVVLTNFTTHDGTPLVPWVTLARDLAVIPGTGTLVDLDTIGDGLHADDTGGAINGWLLDLFGGYDTACRGFTCPIVVGSCNPGDVSGLSCPARIPQLPARPLPQ
ncbi:MAG: IPT/TIG domain-containing protein [Bryobacteraceae bacterium]